MSWGAIVRTALRNVRRRPLRNGLATLGIVLGTATLVALLTLSAALQRALVDRVGERPLLTAIQVTAGSPRAGEPAHVLDGPSADALARLPGVREAIPLVVVPATLRTGERATGGTVIAMSPVHAPYALASGRPPQPTETDALVLTAAGVRFLGFAADTAVGQRISLELRRGDGGTERTTSAWRIVGVIADELPGLGIIPLPQGEDALAWIATGESDAARDLRLAQQMSLQTSMPTRSSTWRSSPFQLGRSMSVTTPSSQGQTIQEAPRRMAARGSGRTLPRGSVDRRPNGCLTATSAS